MNHAHFAQHNQSQRQWNNKASEEELARRRKLAELKEVAAKDKETFLTAMEEVGAEPRATS